MKTVVNNEYVFFFSKNFFLDRSLGIWVDNQNSEQEKIVKDENHEFFYPLLKRFDESLENFKFSCKNLSFY
jgi:hypothetical protein